MNKGTERGPEDRVILATSADRPRQIGHRYTGLWVDGVHYPDLPFVVLREATAEEWAGESGPYPPEAEECLTTGRVLYYEISTD
jgi:hypothetical protein